MVLRGHPFLTDGNGSFNQPHRAVQRHVWSVIPSSDPGELPPGIDSGFSAVSRVTAHAVRGRLPKDDQPPRPAPLLTQPWAAGVTGWIVIFVAVIAELAGGAVVANQTSEAIAIAVLITPVVVVFASLSFSGGK